MNWKRWKLSTTRIIALGFLIGIILGSILLSLPIASRNGQALAYMDALFVATSALCVTGLSTVTLVEQFTVFGQLVILVLIQFGGLGIVTFTTTVLLLLRKRIALSDRLLIQDAYNLDTLDGLVKLTIRIVKGTLLVEFAGAILYTFVFIPKYGFGKGCYYALFHAVSAFCNAGMDLLGDSSLIGYQTHVLMNVTTILLIVLGGIGFPVWWDVLGTGKRVWNKEIKPHQFWQRLSLHTKLVIWMSSCLILVGTVVVFVFEYRNPATIANLSFGDKVLVSLFQSVTTRTAGFMTVPQESLKDATAFFSLLLMFVGGSPSSTAGGVKTVTVALILLSTISLVREKKDIEAFGRKIPANYLRRGLAVIIVSFSCLVINTILLLYSEQKDLLTTIYETTSAFATVGLTRNMTAGLSVMGKWIVIVSMYLGRIGPITMALAFNAKKHRNSGTLPEGKILVG